MEKKGLLTQLEACIADLKRLESELATVEESLRRERERKALIERLIALDEPASASRRLPLDGSFVDAVAAVLKDHGEPMHVSEIRKLLEQEGVRIPGKGLDANIIARIGRDQRFTRVPGRRGFYTFVKPPQGDSSRPRKRVM
jgi:HB1, ASXL, restriction endonuclease HTH domain